MLNWIFLSIKTLTGDIRLSPVCFFVVLLSLSACEEEANPTVEVYQGPEEEVHDVRLLYSESGQTRIEVKTPLQYRYQNDDKFFPDTVIINFFDPVSGQVTTTLRSDSARFDNAKNIYIVKGRVVVLNRVEQRRLKTTELYWSPITKKVYTDADVLIENLATGSYTRGKGLDASQDFSYMSIRKPYGIFDIDPGLQ